MTKADDGVAPASKGAPHVGAPASVGVAELTHDIVRGQLSEYLDGGLGDGDRRRIEQHLGRCRPCQAYHDTLRATVDALAQLPPPVAPPRALRSILDHVRAQARNEPG